MAGRVRIGISGWTYAGWRGPFYPTDLPRSRELEYASRRFETIEINGSFYRMQTPKSYRRWRETTPAGFVFSVKGSRFITHNKKLADIEAPLANFFASGVLFLEEKLGPILWQLSPRLTFDRDRVAEFLDRLPHDAVAAARLARGHDDRVKSPGWPESGGRRRLRHALEIRHPSFLSPELVRIARDSGTALVFSDSASWPYVEELTAGFVYLRLHGSEETYASGYDDEALDGWAARIRAWRDGGEPADPRRITDRVPPPRRSRDIYVYFDNDAKVRAPFDAMALARRLGVGPD